MTCHGRLSAQETSLQIISARFPECRAAFLAGSVVRGDATPTSDLDIVVIIDHPDAPFRESLYYQGWPVELFIHTPESIHRYFASDADRRMPSLPVMVAEGQILRSQDGAAEALQAEAVRLLETGPEPLPASAIEAQRYALTDLLDDLEGAGEGAEAFLIAAELATRAVDLWLGYHARWTGRGKWSLRALRRFDPVQADRLETALARLNQHEQQPLIDFVEAVLAPVGGRLFAGYKQGGRKPDTAP